jgi:hypothetical protein
MTLGRGNRERGEGPAGKEGERATGPPARPREKGKERAREKKREGLGWAGSFLFIFLFYT